MTRCPTCRRHHKTHEAACPFCSAVPTRTSWARNSGLVLLSSIVLMACYGSPPIDDTEVVDADSDGFSSLVDCDDTDAAVNPDATEVCDDGVDNDCDELVDTADTTDCPG